jgi:hypothetical protein
MIMLVALEWVRYCNCVGQIPVAMPATRNIVYLPPSIPSRTSKIIDLRSFKSGSSSHAETHKEAQLERFGVFHVPYPSCVPYPGDLRYYCRDNY